MKTRSSSNVYSVKAKTFSILTGDYTFEKLYTPPEWYTVTDDAIFAIIIIFPPIA